MKTRLTLQGLVLTSLVSLVIAVLFSIPFVLAGSQMVGRLLHEMGRSGMTDPHTAFSGIGAPLLSPFVLVTAFVGAIAGAVCSVSLLRLVAVLLSRGTRGG